MSISSVKPLPPYGRAIKQALYKDSNRLIVVRYGNDGWTHCVVENDDMFSEEPNSNSLVMPEGDHWTEFWWPLKNAKVWIDWPTVPRSECYAFADYLVETVKACEVYYYDPKLDEICKFKLRDLV